MTKAKAKKPTEVMHRNDTTVRWWCPGCNCAHVVPVQGPNAWQFNDDMVHPTLNPSILVRTAFTRCHTFIRDGIIWYLDDSTHELAGQQIPLEPADEP